MEEPDAPGGGNGGATTTANGGAGNATASGGASGARASGGAESTKPDDPVPPALCSKDGAAMANYRLFGLYHFEEEGGVHADDSAGRITEVDFHLNIDQGGTLHGATRGEGACGRGVTLDGDRTHIVLSPVGDVFQNGIAAELWFRPSAIQEGEAHLLGDGGGGLASFQLVLVDGFPVFRLVDGDNGFRDVATSTVAVKPGEWQHLRGRYDGSTAELFLNGSRVAVTSRIFPVAASWNIITVGGRGELTPCCDTGYTFIGDVDEVAIWAKK